jgi:hypothetical protein
MAFLDYDEDLLVINITNKSLYINAKRLLDGLGQSYSEG